MHDFGDLGLPSANKLKSLNIWDSYFTPAYSHPGSDGTEKLFQEIERSMPAINLGCIQRLCYFPHVGIGTTTDPEVEDRLRTNPAIVTRALEKWPSLIGMIQLNGNDVSASLDAINRWLADGPMPGVYFPGSGPGAVTCTHRNAEPLIERVADLQGVIMQHTWFKTGGKKGAGESTPAELAVVARRFPTQKFVCAHAGGQWESGIRAVREIPNILIETSGFDATAGFIEMAVRELGAERIIFGSHLPSRSLGTELGKIVGADIDDSQRRLILGSNFRGLLENIMQSKGMAL